MQHGLFLIVVVALLSGGCATTNFPFGYKDIEELRFKKQIELGRYQLVRCASWLADGTLTAEVDGMKQNISVCAVSRERGFGPKLDVGTTSSKICMYSEFGDCDDSSCWSASAPLDCGVIELGERR